MHATFAQNAITNAADWRKQPNVNTREPDPTIPRGFAESATSKSTIKEESQLKNKKRTNPRIPGHSQNQFRVMNQKTYLKNKIQI